MKLKINLIEFIWNSLKLIDSFNKLIKLQELLKSIRSFLELTSSFANSFTLFQELLKNIKFHLFSKWKDSIWCIITVFTVSTETSIKLGEDATVTVARFVHLIEFLKLNYDNNLIERMKWREAKWMNLAEEPTAAIAIDSKNWKKRLFL